MPQICETRAGKARASRNRFGGWFRDYNTTDDQYDQYDQYDQSLCFHVLQFVPDAQGEDLLQHKSLLKARDYASACGHVGGLRLVLGRRKIDRTD